MLCCFYPISACGGAGPVAEEGGGAAQAGGGQHQPYRLENSEGHGPALPSQEVPLHTTYVTCLCLNGTYHQYPSHLFALLYIASERNINLGGTIMYVPHIIICKLGGEG
jgi:hypothetical protein